MNLNLSSKVAAIALSLATQSVANPPVIDDQELMEKLKTQLGEMAGTEGIPTADALAAKANTAARIQPEIPRPTAPANAGDDNYERLSRSVYLVSSVFKCTKCKHWHQGSSASAWCLGEDGLMVTNAHVFRNAKGEAMGVTDREGKCHPVTELLGLDVATDVALFRVKASGLPALRLGAAADVGAPVTVISNPDGNLFLRTAGSVARYAKRPAAGNQPKVTWMAVTADYAKGSSGGPVFNETGEVVGMVSSTHSIYTESDPAQPKGTPKGEFQMVIRNCVPADAVRNLFEKPPLATNKPE